VMKDRLLRPSLVGVSKNSVKPEKSEKKWEKCCFSNLQFKKKHPYTNVRK
jgi:hypothetical protein